MLDWLTDTFVQVSRIALLAVAAASADEFRSVGVSRTDPTAVPDAAPESVPEPPRTRAPAEGIGGVGRVVDSYAGANPLPSVDPAPRSPAEVENHAESEDSDFYGIPFQTPSLARGRRNLGVRMIPPGSYLQGPSQSILLEVKIHTPSPFKEVFLVQIPKPLPSNQVPLLIVFHKFGSSQKDVLQNTDFLQEANERGWFLVCPLGASKKHFSSIESQVNTEAVLDWMLAAWGARIDRSRIYGVGFSMGGGAVCNFAARHLDPARPMLAAVIDHSGGVSLTNTYYRENSAVRLIFDFWFGDGSPGSADPWQMLRSSLVDVDPATGVASTDGDLARNLMHVPLQIQRATTDAIAYVNQQCDALDRHMLALGRVPGPDYAYEFVSGGQGSYGHSWDMLDFSATCDWLAQWSLEVPSSADTLADRDGVFFHFTIEQEEAGAFTPFSWRIDAALNSLELVRTGNLARATVAAVDAGLDPTQVLSITLEATDGLADELRLTQIPTLPADVRRDSVSISSDWTYDPVSRTLSIAETDPGLHVWQVVP